MAAFIYYGLTMNVGSLGGNLYENFSLLVLVELLGYSVIYFLNKTGRKSVHLLAIFGCGAASIGSILLILFAENCKCVYPCCSVWIRYICIAYPVFINIWYKRPTDLNVIPRVIGKLSIIIIWIQSHHHHHHHVLFFIFSRPH